MTHEQNNQDHLQVDFTHRLSPLRDSLSKTYLCDTIDAMAGPIEAQLLMLGDHLCRSGENSFNPEIINNFIEGIRLGVLDIKNTVDAYHRAPRAQNRGDFK